MFVDTACEWEGFIEQFCDEVYVARDELRLNSSNKG